MREILFRGKRTDSGEWVYGDLLQDEDLDVCMIEYFEYYSSDTGLERDYHQDAIISETVGQYTGLTDRTGKKIFEGDILRWTADDGERGTVYVEYRGGVFGLYCTSVPSCDPDLFADFELGEQPLEIIGNVHDNLELLGGVDNETL